MKALKLLTILFCLFYFSGFSQTFHYDYQDGLVVFQLKESAKTFPSREKKVDFHQIGLYDKLKEFTIVEMLQLHPSIKDEKLKRTFQIEVASYADVEGVIRVLKVMPEIEYAEKKELHRIFLTPNDLGG
jgi:hypothetical protein